MTMLAVAIGGAVGAVARYLLSGWVQALGGASLPWGTLAVNLSGSLAIGFVAVWLQHLVSVPDMRELIVVGFLGSFTTFSAVSLETLEMIRLGEWWRATGYTFGSLFFGVLAAALGATLAGAIFQRPA
jgi:CrcB protein